MLNSFAQDPNTGGIRFLEAFLEATVAGFERVIFDGGASRRFSMQDHEVRRGGSVAYV